MPGGQCTALYPEKPIYDIPGYPRIEAAELVAGSRHRPRPSIPSTISAQQVQALEPRERRIWRFTTSTGTASQAKAVIIAAGVGAFGPNRPPLPGSRLMRARASSTTSPGARTFAASAW